MKIVKLVTTTMTTVRAWRNTRGLLRAAQFAFSIQLVLVGGAAPAAASSSQGQPGEKNAAEIRVEKRQAERMAKAQPTRLVSSHYSIQGSDETTLYMINKVSEPIEVEVEALNGAGAPLLLGSYVLEPRQHTTVDLRQMLGVYRGHHTGSLRIDFVGDGKMVQAWAVLQRGQNVVEIPLQASGDQGWQRISFWDTRALANDIVPQYFVVNGSEFPVAYEIRLGQDEKGLYKLNGTLKPGAREVITPTELDRTLRHGWLWLEVAGAQPGATVATGLLHAVASKPVAPRAEAAAARLRSDYLSRLELAPSALSSSFTRFASLGFPLADGSGDTSGRTLLSLFNGSENTTQAEVVLVSFESGAELGRRQVFLTAGQILSLNLDRLADQAGPLPGEARIQVQADAPLRLWSASELPSGEVLEVTLFGLAEAHQSGSYPLPSLDGFHTVSTLVNVGTEPTTILGQVSWDSGTYALEPVEIPAGEARRIDFAEIVEAQEADLLGRKLTPAFRQGFFQWTARHSHEVIGRTEVRRIDGADRFGFNCGSCCQEESFGDILPGSIILDFDTSTTFDGVEYVGTCTGTLGPYSIFGFNSLSYSSPVTWNGHSVSSSNLTDQWPEFTAWGDTVFDDGWECTQGNVLFGDDDRVRADDCQEEHNPPPFDPTRSCGDQSGSCTNCKSCCEKQKAVGDCRCDKLPFGVSVCKTGVKVACQDCKINSCVCGGSNLC